MDTGEPQTQQRAIFVLHRPTIESRAQAKAKLLNAENSEKKQQLLEDEKRGKSINKLLLLTLQSTAKPEVQFVRPLSDENPRLVGQGGLFSRIRGRKTLEQWVAENHEATDIGYSLIKILVPNRDRNVCLQNLNRMNINHLSLFPDLYGASKFCNLFSDINKY